MAGASATSIFDRVRPVSVTDTRVERRLLMHRVCPHRSGLYPRRLDRNLPMAFEVFTSKERSDLRSGIFAVAFRPPFVPEFMSSRWYFSTSFFGAYLEFAFAPTGQRKSAAAATHPHNRTHDNR
jgi:hypothetical protein